MKKFLLLFLCASTFWACHNSGSKHEHVKPEANAQHQEEAAATLTLDNGSKWESDSSTNRNVSELKTIANRFQEMQSHTLADYKAVATNLQAGLDKMIKECRMQGAAHDALHSWLEPILNKVNALQKAVTEEEASKLFTDISMQLRLYNQYFK